MTGKIMIYRDQENCHRNVNSKDVQETSSFSKRSMNNDQQQSRIDSCNTTNDDVITESLSGRTITVSSSSSRSKSNQTVSGGIVNTKESNVVVVSNMNVKHDQYSRKEKDFIGRYSNKSTTVRPTILKNHNPNVKRNVPNDVRNDENCSVDTYNYNQHHWDTHSVRSGNSAGSMGTLTVGSLHYIDTSAMSVEQLRFKLQELQCEVSGDRAIIRKKDQNIVKLAKQLSVYSNDIQSKDQQIMKLAKAMNELESLLRQQNFELVYGQEKLREICRETENKIQEYESIILTLRKEVIHANDVAMKLKQQVLEMEQKHIYASVSETNEKQRIIDDGDNVVNELENHSQQASFVFVLDRRTCTTALGAVAGVIGVMCVAALRTNGR